MSDQDFYDNLKNFGFATMAAASQPAATPLGAIGQGGIGMNQAALQGQQIKSAQLQNQLGVLNLQRAQAMQPMVMNQIKGMTNNSSGGAGGMGASGSGSPASVYAQQALMAAMASGNQEQISKAYLSLYEHDPELAGQIKASQESNTLQKTPQGTYITVPVTKQGTVIQPSSPAGYNSTSSAAGGESPNNQTRVAPSAPQSNANDNTPSQPVILNIKNTFPTSSDGRPIIPGRSKLAPADPTGTPTYKTDLTDTGVNQTKLFQEADMKANEALSSQAANLQNERFRLEELAKVYKQVQAGTLTAQNPELATKLIAWGVIKDPKEISNVAQIQNALHSHVLQIIQQIKDTNANMGGAPTRTFGSEIQNLQEKGETPDMQPEALYNIIGQAKGIVDHHMDMVNGWNDIGGLGNRVASGYTLRPDDYARQFIKSHDIQDYKTNALKSMGEFKGMSPQSTSAAHPHDGTVATNAKGDKMVLRNGQWMPM